MAYYYHPHPKDGEGNVYTGVYSFTREGGGVAPSPITGPLPSPVPGPIFWGGVPPSTVTGPVTSPVPGPVWVLPL